jgi:hypothetical protein
MRKNAFKMVGVAMLLFTMSSCGDKTTTGADAPLAFSPLTVEQQKSTISNDGIALGNKMELAKETPALKTVEFLSNSQVTVPSFSAPLREFRAGLLRNDVKAMETFNRQMTSASVLDSVKWGTMTWNEAILDYEYTPNTNSSKTIIVKFPADSISKSKGLNNGTLTIIYTSSNVLVPEHPEEKMPASLSVILKVGTTEALNFLFTGTYKTDATPTLLSSTLEIGDFNWNAKATNNDKEIAAEFSFKHKTDILLKYTAGVSGNLTADYIKTIVNDTTGKKGPQDVFASGYMSFQVMNTAIYGGITDFKTFANGMDAIKEDTIYQKDQNGNIYKDWYYTIRPKVGYEQEVLLMNKHLKFYGYFVKENGKFADVEFYLNEYQATDYDQSKGTLVYTQKSYNDPWPSVKYDYMSYEKVYNPTTMMDDYVMKFYLFGTKTQYESAPRLVLKDGSKITDFAKYANDNFKTVIDKFTNMLPK